MENEEKLIKVVENEEVEIIEAGEVEKPKMSAISKVIGIVISPAKTLEDIKRNPNIWVPIAIIIVISLATSFMTWPVVEQTMIIEIEQSMRTQGVEMTKDMLDMTLLIGKISAIGFIPIMLIIGVLIEGLYYFISSIIVKKKMRYKQSISMLAHVGIIGMIGMCVFSIVMIMTGEISLIGNVTSLGSFLPTGMQGTFLAGMAQTIEVFNIWSLYLLYMGLRIIASFSKKAAIITVGISWLVMALFTGTSIMLQSVLSTIG